MADADLQPVEHQLASITLPATGAPLGQKGTRFEVQADGDRRAKVRILLGFPADRYAGELRRQLLERCGRELPEWSLSFDIDWQVQSHAVQSTLKPLPGISNLVAVASGKGGVGKSTIAVNLALALAAEGARVGILDADIYGPSQPRMLGLVGEQPTTEDGKTLEPLSAHGLVAMSIGFLVDDAQPMVWRGPMVTSALNQLLSQTRWGELDYLIVDMPPGTGDIQLTLSQQVPVSGAVIVTTPQDIALADARKGLAMFRKVNVPVLGIVENMSFHICESCGHQSPIFGSGGGEQLAGQFETRLLGQVPLNVHIREQTDGGRPTVVADPDGPLTAAYLEIARNTAGQLAGAAKDYSHRFPKITVENT